MTSARTDWIVYAGLIGFGLFGPLLFPAYTNQIAVMWLMVLMAVTWDVMGGQTGYNSLGNIAFRSEEHTSELQSLMRISYAVFCLKKKNTHKYTITKSHSLHYKNSSVTQHTNN